MIYRGHEPNIVTYTTLVDGLCQKGLLDKAKSMLQYIISKGHEPDVVTDNEMKRIQKYVQKEVLSSLTPEEKRKYSYIRLSLGRPWTALKA